MGYVDRMAQRRRFMDGLARQADDPGSLYQMVAEARMRRLERLQERLDRWQELLDREKAEVKQALGLEEEPADEPSDIGSPPEYPPRPGFTRLQGQDRRQRWRRPGI